MLNAIKNPLVSVSELKKSPMKIIEQAKNIGDGIYILNNNKDVGVVIDNERYKELIDELDSLKQKQVELEDHLLYLEAELRIAKNSQTLSDGEVRPSLDKKEIDDLVDEWE